MRRLAFAAVMLSAMVARAAVDDDLRDGDKYFEERDWRRAATSYDRAISKGPTEVPPSAYGKRAAIFIILKDYKAGLDFLAKAKARYPNAPEILEEEALILWETEHKEEAIHIAETVVKLRPQTFSNQKLIGEFYTQRDPQRTAAAYEAYLASRPPELEGGDVLPRVRLGFAYLANARAALAASDDAAATALYGKAAEQFDMVQRKFGKKANAQINANNGLCAAYTGMDRFDQAVTVCERVTKDPSHVDATGSAWFNLGTAYLARKQTQRARAAAQEFTKVRKTEARGFILVGDTYFADRDWPGALDSYLKAEKLVRPNQQRDQVQLSIRLGKTYRRMPVASGKGSNLELAIEKLGNALASNPNSLELAVELGGAYLDAHQDGKALALTDRLVATADFGKQPAEPRAGVLVLGGKAHFNTHKLREARQQFEAAQQLRGTDVTIQRDLVLVINEQAFEATRDPKAAQGLLEQALAVDPTSPVTIANLAVLALDRSDCDGALRHLTKLEQIRGHDAVVRLRLLARSYLCGARPDPKRAAETFALAEREAKKANAALALAEIYTEWAPLTWDTDLQGAVDKLESAVQSAGQDPDIAPAAKRNLALALYRRGWKSMRENRSSDAANDFERATRDPSVLKGTEGAALDFSFALALLDGGRNAEAGKLFKSLAAKGNQASYLKAPYAKVGSQFFAAYASYRGGTLQARQQAAADFAKLEPEMAGDKLKELLASSWETIAFEQWKSGQAAAAARSLQTAEKDASGDAKRRIAMDRAALALDKRGLGTLEGLGGNPPESLVDLGILYDQLGRPKDAYDAWVRAKARGVVARDLQKWIDAKKRIYGY